MELHLTATCGLGLEPLLADELEALGVEGVAEERGAVSFRGGWTDVWRSNWRLRTANRVLVRLGAWSGLDGESLARGAFSLVTDPEVAWAGVPSGELFHPGRTFSLHATVRASRVTDPRWAVLRVKDGLVDGQRKRFGSRSSVERRTPDLKLRVWMVKDRATLLLDTSGESLDRRGYRVATGKAPLREQLAAACVLAAGPEALASGVVVDPMCGGGTLLIEAGHVALGWAPARLRSRWAFERLPGFDHTAFAAIRDEPLPTPAPEVRLFGRDLSPAAVRAAQANIDRAGLDHRASLEVGDAFDLSSPAESGLVLINPPYGERLAEDTSQWRQIGDLLKQRYQGFTAVVIAGDAGKGKHIGLRPKRRIPVKNGPIDARLLVFDLY